MSYQHLRPREHYEDLYDRLTVKTARRGIVHYVKFYSEFESKLPKNDKIGRPGNALLLNVFYMQVVGNELLSRYEHRDERIDEWMAGDVFKDEQITAAKLTEEPFCQHCSKKGLRIIDKMLTHRGDSYEPGSPEELLFMLMCTNCGKNSAFWEDGTARTPKPTLCPKCGTEMTHKSVETKKAITITYTCPSCGHSYKDKLDLRDNEEQPDPDYDKDRAHFCLWDKEFRDKLFEVRRGLEEMARLGKEWKEKEDNKDLYDALAQIKKLKIPDLTPLLAPTLEKASYVNFSLDKPEMGKDVIIGFSCLDNKSDRKDYDSRASLNKLVKETLKDTNWRLMTDGATFRLGYLAGRLRAYEREEDLAELVMRTKKLKK